MKKVTELKVGMLVCFTSGQPIDDYGHHGAFLVLVDVSEAELKSIVEEVKSKAEADDETGYHDQYPMFADELVRRGFLKSVGLQEMHLGCYGLELGGQQ